MEIYEGGALYLSGASSIEIIKSKFNNNIAATYGGGLYAAAFASIKINKDSVFGDNRSHQLGDDIYVANSENTIELDDFRISNAYAESSIYVESASVIMNEAYIYNIAGGEKGGAL
jgi:predicted outer membrane repeat protein